MLFLQICKFKIIIFYFFISYFHTQKDGLGTAAHGFGGAGVAH